MLTQEDSILIQDAVREGVFWGSFWGAIVFHLFLFGGFFLIYWYLNKKYGDKVKGIGQIVFSLIGKH